MRCTIFILNRPKLSLSHTHTRAINVFPCFQPEWYLTQVLMWMSNNSTFMEEKIQLILERAGTNISARVGPCRFQLGFYFPQAHIHHCSDCVY